MKQIMIAVDEETHKELDRQAKQISKLTNKFVSKGKLVKIMLERNNDYVEELETITNAFSL